MNFAPYQDESPEIERALSPPPLDNRIKPPHLRSPRASADLPSPRHFGGIGNTGFGRDVEGGHVSLGAFETSLPIRMDVEAMLAYLLLPPAGGVFLLLTEHRSDYVRYVSAISVEISFVALEMLISKQIPCLAIQHALHRDFRQYQFWNMPGLYLIMYRYSTSFSHFQLSCLGFCL